MSSALRSPWLKADLISSLQTAHEHNSALSEAEAEVTNRRRKKNHHLSIHDVTVGGPKKRLQLCGEYADLGNNKLRVTASDTLHSVLLLMSPETWALADAQAGGCGSLARNTGAIIGITEAHFCLSQRMDGRFFFYLFVAKLTFWGAENCDIRGHPLPLVAERDFWTRAASFMHVPVDDTGRQIESAYEGEEEEEEEEEEEDIMDVDDRYTSNNQPFLPSVGLKASGRHIGWGDFDLCDSQCVVPRDQLLHTHMLRPDVVQPIGYVAADTIQSKASAGPADMDLALFHDQLLNDDFDLAGDASQYRVADRGGVEDGAAKHARVDSTEMNTETTSRSDDEELEQSAAEEVVLYEEVLDDSDDEDGREGTQDPQLASKAELQSDAAERSKTLLRVQNPPQCDDIGKFSDDKPCGGPAARNAESAAKLSLTQSKDTEHDKDDQEDPLSQYLERADDNGDQEELPMSQPDYRPGDALSKFPVTKWDDSRQDNVAAQNSVPTDTVVSAQNSVPTDTVVSAQNSVPTDTVVSQGPQESAPKLNFSQESDFSQLNESQLKRASFAFAVPIRDMGTQSFHDEVSPLRGEHAAQLTLPCMETSSRYEASSVVDDGECDRASPAKQRSSHPTDPNPASNPKLQRPTLSVPFPAAADAVSSPPMGQHHHSVPSSPPAGQPQHAAPSPVFAKPDASQVTLVHRISEEEREAEEFDMDQFISYSPARGDMTSSDGVQPMKGVEEVEEEEEEEEGFEVFTQPLSQGIVEEETEDDGKLDDEESQQLQDEGLDDEAPSQRWMPSQISASGWSIGMSGKVRSEASLWSQEFVSTCVDGDVQFSQESGLVSSGRSLAEARIVDMKEEKVPIGLDTRIPKVVEVIDLTGDSEDDEGEVGRECKRAKLYQSVLDIVPPSSPPHNVVQYQRSLLPSPAAIKTALMEQGRPAENDLKNHKQPHSQTPDSDSSGDEARSPDFELCGIQFINTSFKIPKAMSLRSFVRRSLKKI
ncbi:hypothetical protein BC830DRAFT_1082394 [Chytriomyces sp. MP71]|nr:hypothetical protein BC830DRAFT_1082394 [Chytriomyces sp. MP71]